MSKIINCTNQDTIRIEFLGEGRARSLPVNEIVKVLEFVENSKDEQQPSISQIRDELRRMAEWINSAILRDGMSDNARIGCYVTQIIQAAESVGQTVAIVIETNTDFGFDGHLELRNDAFLEPLKIEQSYECGDLVSLLCNLTLNLENHIGEQ